MKLYYVPRTRSTRPRWMLEEIGVPYELVRLDPARGETRDAAHTARHPLQHVPVLETRDGLIFESAAMVLHLADLYPERELLAAPGTHARALAYQWLFYAMTELEPPCIEYFELLRAQAPTDTPEAARMKERFHRALHPLEAGLARHDFLVGHTFSAADVVVGSVLAWAAAMRLVHDVPRVEAYLTRMKARPAFKAAFAD